MYIFNARVQENEKECIVHLYMVESACLSRLLYTFIYGLYIVLMKRYINFTERSENVDFFKILQYSCSFLFKIDESSIKY